jgi:hypothetical protein
MSIYAAPGASFEASAANFVTGLTGTIGVRVTDGVGATVTARTTSGIAEYPAGSGIYTVTLSAPGTAGQYQVVWDSGGSPVSWASEELVVTSSGGTASVPSGFDLCTLADVRQALELPSGDTSRDDLIQTMITQNSRAIINEADREFAPTTASATRRFRLGSHSLTLDLSPYDLRSATSVVLNPESANSTTLTAMTDYQLIPVQPRDGTYLGIRFASNQSNLHTSDTARDFGYTLVDVTGAWGFASVPNDVRRATVIAVTASLRRDITELAIAGIEDAQAIATEGPATHSIPVASRRLIAPYRRNGGAF